MATKHAVDVVHVQLQFISTTLRETCCFLCDAMRVHVLDFFAVASPDLLASSIVDRTLANLPIQLLGIIPIV